MCVDEDTSLNPGTNLFSLVISQHKNENKNKNKKPNFIAKQKSPELGFCRGRKTSTRRSKVIIFISTL